MRLSKRAIGAAVVAAQLLLASGAYAAESEADRLFEQGRAAVRAGEHGKALERFEQSQRLDPAVGTLLNIADCEERLGKLASAWAHLRQAVEQMKADDDRLAPTKARVAAVEPRVPRLTIVLTKGVADFTKVTRDDVDLAGPLLGTEQPVDPGKHQVFVAAPGHQRRVFRVELKASERKTLKVEPGDPIEVAAAKGTPPPVVAAPIVARRAPPDEPPEAPSAPPWKRIPLGYWVGGVGAASLVVGLGTGAAVFAKKGTIGDHCDAAKVCDQEGLDAASSAHTLATVSTVATVVGVAGLGVGAYLLLARPAAGQPTASLHLAPLAGGAALGFRREF